MSPKVKGFQPAQSWHQDFTKVTVEYVPPQDLRRAGCVVCVGDTAVQYEELDGAADAQCAVVLSDPSTGQTGSVAAPIGDGSLKRRLVARCCPTIALAIRAQAVTAAKYREAATAIGCRGNCGQAAAHSGAGRC